MPRIALIHALAHAVQPINAALARDFPQAQRMNLLDDSLSADLAQQGRGLDAVMHQRFARLAQYAVDCGADAILFTCSAFGPCIEAVATAYPHLPVLKPNEAMLADVYDWGAAQPAPFSQAVGLIATFAPTLDSMRGEFAPQLNLKTACAPQALTALNAGDAAQHTALIVQAAVELAAQGCSAIALAQFSMVDAAAAVAQRTGLRVFTPVDSAVQRLRAGFMT
jgi:Asp/Glu/Hydantoin racemase